MCFAEKVTVFLLFIGLFLSTAVFSGIDVEEKVKSGNAKKDSDKKIKVPDPASVNDNGQSTGRKHDQIRFLNKDTLHGKFLSTDPEKGLLWKHPDVEKTILFKLKNIDCVDLADKKRLSNASQTHQVRLTNGDTLSGRIVSMDAEKLLLETWYAKQLRLSRPMIESISPNVSKSIHVYEGPSGIEGWNLQEHNNKSWTYKNNAFYSKGGSGSIGKDVKLPDKSRLEFDLSWKGRLQFYIYFYTDNIKGSGGNCYYIQLNRNYGYLYRSTSHGSNNFGNFRLGNDFQTKSNTRVSILTDKEKKKIALVMDGNIVQQWTDSNDFAGKGTGVVFYVYNNTAVKVENILVTKWDGEIGEKEDGKTKAEEKDMIYFVNNDMVSGKLISIQENNILFKTDFADLNVPIKRVVRVIFARENLHKARLNKMDIQGFFNDEHRVTINLKNISETAVSGSSENFGKGSFNLKAFKRLTFNIYKKRPEEENDIW